MYFRWQFILRRSTVNMGALKSSKFLSEITSIKDFLRYVKQFSHLIKVSYLSSEWEQLENRYQVYISTISAIMYFQKMSFRCSWNVWDFVLFQFSIFNNVLPKYWNRRKGGEKAINKLTMKINSKSIRLFLYAPLLLLFLSDFHAWNAFTLLIISI